MTFKGLLPSLFFSAFLLLGLIEPSNAEGPQTELQLSQRLSAVQPSAEQIPTAQISLQLALDTDVRRSLIRHVLLLKGRTLLGVAYLYGSNDGDATDCSGLVGQVFEAAGISLPRASRDIASMGNNVLAADMQVGDVVIYRFKSGLHAAIYVGEDQILHASPKYGVVVTALDDSWRKRMVTARRIV